MWPGIDEVRLYHIILSVADSLLSLFTTASKVGCIFFVAYPLTVRHMNNFLVIS